jgi:hypothetical protein
VHFNGSATSGTATKNASYNVSSVDINAAGVYTVNFTTALADAYYVVAGTCTADYGSPGTDANTFYIGVARKANAQQAGSCRVVADYSGFGNYQQEAFRVVFIR